MLSPGDVVAVLAVVVMEPPDTAPLGVEVPGTVEAVPGAVVGKQILEGQRGKTAGRDLSESRSRNYVQCPLH